MKWTIIWLIFEQFIAHLLCSSIMKLYKQIRVLSMVWNPLAGSSSQLSSGNRLIHAIRTRWSHPCSWCVLLSDSKPHSDWSLCSNCTNIHLLKTQMNRFLVSHLLKTGMFCIHHKDYCSFQRRVTRMQHLIPGAFVAGIAGKSKI